MPSGGGIHSISSRRKLTDSDIVYPAGRQPSGQIRDREVEPDRSNEPSEPTKKRSMFAGLRLKANAPEHGSDRNWDTAIDDRQTRHVTVGEGDGPICTRL